MANGFLADDDSFQGGIEPEPSAVGGSQVFDTDQDQFDISIPRSFMGGLDHLNSSYQKAAFKLRQKTPTYTLDGITYKEPPSTEGRNTFIPITGETTYSGLDQDSFISNQEKMARQLESSLPRGPDGGLITSAHVAKNIGTIYQQLKSGSDGDLTPQTFWDNPYWEQFQGLSNEALSAFKNDVAKNIQPIIRHEAAVGNLMTGLKSLNDDPNGIAKDLWTSLAPENKGEIEAVIRGKSRNVRTAQGIIKTIQDKVDIANSDPLVMDNFKELLNAKNNGTLNKDDQQYLTSALFSHSGSAFNHVMYQYIQKNENDKQKQQDLHDFLDNELVDLKGQETDAFRIQMSELIDSKQITHGKLSSILRESKSNANGVGINGSVLPSLLNPLRESQIVKGIQTMSNEHDINKLVIKSNGKVVFEEPGEMQKLINEDAVHRHGDVRTNAKIPGDLVALDRDSLIGVDGQPLHLAVPIMMNGKKVIQPASFINGDIEYYSRAVLKKIGITQAQMEGDEKIEMPGGFEDFSVKDESLYEPVLVKAGDFMKLPEGSRLKAMKQLQIGLDQSMEAQRKFIDTQIESLPTPEKISWMKDVVWNTAARHLEESGVGMGLAVPAIANSLANLVKGVYHSITDPEKAKHEFESIMGSHDEEGKPVDVNSIGGFLKTAWENPDAMFGNIGSLKSRIRVTADYESELNGWNAKEGMTTTQKVASALVGGLTEAATMAAQFQIGGAAKAGEIASQFLTKFTTASKLIEGIKTVAPTTEGLFEIQKAKKSLDYANSILKAGVEMTVYGAERGDVKGNELLMNAMKGGAFGWLSTQGRGMRLPRVPGVTEEVRIGKDGVPEISKAFSDISRPWYPDIAKFKAATLATSGFFGLDYVNSLYEGKTQQEIVDQMKDPEYIANNLIPVLTFGMLGQKQTKIGENLYRGFETKGNGKLITGKDFLLSPEAKAEKEGLKYPLAVREETPEFIETRPIPRAKTQGRLEYVEPKLLPMPLPEARDPFVIFDPERLTYATKFEGLSSALDKALGKSPVEQGFIDSINESLSELNPKFKGTPAEPADMDFLKKFKNTKPDVDLMEAINMVRNHEKALSQLDVAERRFPEEPIEPKPSEMMELENHINSAPPEVLAKSVLEVLNNHKDFEAARTALERETFETATERLGSFIERSAKETKDPVIKKFLTTASNAKLLSSSDLRGNKIENLTKDLANEFGINEVGHKVMIDNLKHLLHEGIIGENFRAESLGEKPPNDISGMNKEQKSLYDKSMEFLKSDRESAAKELKLANDQSLIDEAINSNGCIFI